jgi:hypothetical protein
MEEKNWPPFFPIIHHDIANEIPANVQKLQYLAFASWLGTFWSTAGSVFCSVSSVASRLFTFRR